MLSLGIEAKYENVRPERKKLHFFVKSENGRLMGGWVSVLLSTPKMSGWWEAGFQFYFQHLKCQAGDYSVWESK